ncbi:MAG: amidohydrolase family protein [Actinobacteria bacterium]|nr:amidohydrolase family protein [Actinomycetota bacterium]
MAINGMKVVDSHVHLLPGRLGEKVRAFFDAGIGSRLQLAYPNNHDYVVESLHREGVDAFWTLPYAHKSGVARGLNEASAATAQQFAEAPIQIIPGLTVHPGDDDAVTIVQDAVDSLALRVLKLHCSVGSFTIDDPQLKPVFAFANERRLPVIVHLGHNVNGRTEAEELPSIAKVSDDYPDVPMILAHCGHHSAPTALQLMREHPSLYADLTPVVSEFPDVDVESLEELSDRILFGTDAPNTTISVTKCLQWLSEMNLSRNALSSIVGENASRLTSQVAT